MKRMKGFTLIELLIVVAIIAILAAIAVPNFLEAQVRSKVSRVRTDHRSLATAIEAYYVDNNSYPAGTNIAADSAYAYLTAAGFSDTIRTLAIRTTNNGADFNTLTTPIAYVTSLFPDAFADNKGMTFPYWSNRYGWILGSWGPDTDQASGGNLLWNDATYHTYGDYNTVKSSLSAGVETVYDPVASSQPSQILVSSGGTAGAYTYDPTNGTVSDGDVWRVKQ